MHRPRRTRCRQKSRLCCPPRGCRDHGLGGVRGGCLRLLGTPLLPVPSLPDCLARSFANMGEAPQICQTMFGTSEFDVTGTLRTWDVSSRLDEIEVPTLLTSGRHDQMTPAVTSVLHERIRGSEWALFEDSSHTWRTSRNRRSTAPLSSTFSSGPSGLRSRAERDRPRTLACLRDLREAVDVARDVRHRDYAAEHRNSGPKTQTAGPDLGPYRGG